MAVLTPGQGVRGPAAWQWPAALGVALALLSALAFVIVAGNLPVALFGGAAHDDAWFWQRASTIATGSWMGRYDEYTLIKGSGYPLFLAVAHVLGLPVTVAQALLHATACLLFGYAVYRVTGRRGVALVLVLALQWHPAALSWTRVVRDNVSAAQVLLVLSGVLMMWAARRRWSGLAWATLAGASLGWFWTTREDGLWLLPGIVMLVVVAAGYLVRHRAAWRPLLVRLAWATLVFAAWLALVTATHAVKYGEAAAVEITDSSFKDALVALQSVRAGEVVPYVPVPEQVRLAVYDVSPAFNQLRPALEGTVRGWTEHGCAVYAHSCGDYAGGWFLWALRDAAARTGVHASAPEAEAFYRRLADEVGGACADGRLACSPGVGMMPAVAPAQWGTLPAALQRAIRLLAWRGVGSTPPDSHLAHPSTPAMWTFLGRPWIPDGPAATGAQVSGWFHSPAGRWIRGRCDGDAAAFRIARRPSTDLAAHFDDPAAARIRFAFRLRPDASCTLELGSGAGHVDLVEAAAGQRFDFGGEALQIEALGGIPPSAAAAPAWPAAVAGGVRALTAHVMPWLLAAGLLAFAWCAARALRHRRYPGVAWMLAGCAWLLVASRVLLLALVDVSAFPAIHVQYLQPAFFLVLVAAVASIAALRDSAAVAPISSSGTRCARRSGLPGVRGKRSGSP